jgi:chemotaxis protein CheX
MSDIRVVLPANLDLLAASPLRDELAGHAGKDIVLDAGGVERLGALCLQVLLAASTKWRSEGFSIGVINPSAAFSDHLRVLGASEHLNIQTGIEVCA